MVRKLIGTATALGVATAIGIAHAEAGEDMPGWEAGPVEVASVRFAGVLEIARGDAHAPFWLAGIDAAGAQDGELATRASTAVREWTAAGPVEMLVPKRRARAGLEGVLRLSDGSLLNTRLVEEGYALYAPGSLSESFTREIRLAQADAKRKKNGIWGVPLVDLFEAPVARNQLGTYCAAVANVKLKEENADHVHLGGTYPRHFLTLEIAPELRALVTPILRTEHEACATGRVQPRDTAPAMVVNDATQVRERRPQQP